MPKTATTKTPAPIWRGERLPSSQRGHFAHSLITGGPWLENALHGLDGFDQANDALFTFGEVESALLSEATTKANRAAELADRFATGTAPSADEIRAQVLADAAEASAQESIRDMCSVVWSRLVSDRDAVLNAGQEEIAGTLTHALRGIRERAVKAGVNTSTLDPLSVIERNANAERKVLDECVADLGGLRRDITTYHRAYGSQNIGHRDFWAVALLADVFELDPWWGFFAAGLALRNERTGERRMDSAIPDMDDLAAVVALLATQPEQAFRVATPHQLSDGLGRIQQARSIAAQAVATGWRLRRIDPRQVGERPEHIGQRVNILEPIKPKAVTVVRVDDGDPDAAEPDVWTVVERPVELVIG